MKIQRNDRLIALVAFLGMVISAFVLVFDYRGEVADHRAVMVDRAQTTLDALAAGLRAHGRMGRFRHERLALIFEELAETRDVRYVALEGAGGQVIASAGDPPEGEPDGNGVPHWTTGMVSLCQSLALELGGFGGGGGGRGWMSEQDAWEPLPAGPHVIVVAMDTGAMTDEINQDRLRGGIAFGVVFLMITSVSLVMAGWTRRRSLQTALLVAETAASHQAQLTRLGAGLAHETKNPLGIIRGQAQLIVDESDEEKVHSRERAQIIVDEIDRTVGQIDAFLKLARPTELHLEPVAIRDVFASLEKVLGDEARHLELALGFEVDDRVVMADADKLRRILLNLVLNSFQASEPGGHIALVVEGTLDDTVLSVRDGGCGIGVDDLAHVLEPYYSGFQSGCGLGLALVQQLALAHGWTVRIESEPGKGTTVSLCGLRCRAGDADG